MADIPRPASAIRKRHAPETSVKSVKRRESSDVRSRDDALQSNFSQVGRGLEKELKTENLKLKTLKSEAGPAEAGTDQLTVTRTAAWPGRGDRRRWPGGVDRGRRPCRRSPSGDCAPSSR